MACRVKILKRTMLGTFPSLFRLAVSLFNFHA
jgi:hypothetical protein